jgi:hypothetical protein
MAGEGCKSKRGERSSPLLTIFPPFKQVESTFNGKVLFERGIKGESLLLIETSVTGRNMN